MAQRKLLTNGNAFQRTDKRWGGVVWYMDEHGERKRKSFSGTTKAEVNKKMTNYIAAFDKMLIESDESKKTLEDSMNNWLRVFIFPALERGSYDRLECTAMHQVYPLLGKKAVGNLTSATEARTSITPSASPYRDVGDAHDAILMMHRTETLRAEHNRWTIWPPIAVLKISNNNRKT